MGFMGSIGGELWMIRKKKIFSVRLSLEELERLKQCANVEGTSIGEQIRQAVKEFLRKQFGF